MKRVLNVGGGASRDLPAFYKGWTQVLLDIDPQVKPDVVCDAKQMGKLPKGIYDAVYCSHNLEHFYRHEVPNVLAGFQHVLKADGFAHVMVPDMNALFDAIRDRDINETWYRVSAGPISFHDVIYGWGKMVANGNLHYCHKTGFTEQSLTKALHDAKFKPVMTASDGMNLHAYAFKDKPAKILLQRLGL